eukprot:EG_transcript_16749
MRSCWVTSETLPARTWPPDLCDVAVIPGMQPALRRCTATHSPGVPASLKAKPSAPQTGGFSPDWTSLAVGSLRIMEEHSRPDHGCGQIPPTQGWNQDVA